MRECDFGVILLNRGALGILQVASCTEIMHLRSIHVLFYLG